MFPSTLSFNPTNSNVSLNQPIKLDVIHALDELFALCRVPFVNDFIFTSDPVADISILTSPVQNEHVAAARIHTSGVEVVPTPNAHFFNYTADFLFCSIPAFSVGSITLGFATQTSVDPSTSLIPSTASLNGPNAVNAAQASCYRFVRDDVRGMFLLVSGLDSDRIEFDCMIHRSSSRRTRLGAHFRTKAFQEAIRSSGGTLNPISIAPTLQYLTVAYEKRTCPICKAGNDKECGCELPFNRPSHPLDFRNEMINMALHTGTFKGSSVVQIFAVTNSSGNYPIATSTLNTIVTINAGLEKPIVTNLCRTAVQNRLMVLASDPLTSSTPVNLQQQAPTHLLARPPSLQLHNMDEIATQARSVQQSQVDTPPLENRSTSINTEKLQAQSSTLKVSQDGPTSATPQQEDFLGSLFDGLEDSSLLIRDGSKSISNSGNWESMPRLENACFDGDTPKSKVDNGGGSTRADGESTDNSLTKSFWSAGLQAMTADSVQESEIRTHSSGDRFSDSKGEVQDEEDTPAGENLKVAATGAKVNKACVNLDERSARVEERRRRNRLAAAKSNVKRKIRNETLKRDLSEIRKRLAELREKEKELRMENVRLRVLAQKKNLGVGIHLTHIQMPTS